MHTHAHHIASLCRVWTHGHAHVISTKYACGRTSVPFAETAWVIICPCHRVAWLLQPPSLQDCNNILSCMVGFNFVCMDLARSNLVGKHDHVDPWALEEETPPWFLLVHGCVGGITNGQLTNRILSSPDSFEVEKLITSQAILPNVLAKLQQPPCKHQWLPYARPTGLCAAQVLRYPTTLTVLRNLSRKKGNNLAWGRWPSLHQTGGMGGKMWQPCGHEGYHVVPEFRWDEACSHTRKETAIATTEWLEWVSVQPVQLSPWVL